ncbi:hypothetical protein CPB86DRAFT_782890 [Serendipita vermifera]|nr:hypothetical protein CPB86DRAFT_782890 [Serendipita vermifera]
MRYLYTNTITLFPFLCNQVTEWLRLLPTRSLGAQVSKVTELVSSLLQTELLTDEGIGIGVGLENGAKYTGTRARITVKAPRSAVGLFASGPGTVATSRGCIIRAEVWEKDNNDRHSQQRD